MVKELAATKPDIIKLMITGGVLDAKAKGEPGALKMPPEYVKAAVDAAHALGFKVAAHVESNEGMLVALRNGVDTLEHGGRMTEEIRKPFEVILREEGNPDHILFQKSFDFMATQETMHCTVPDLGFTGREEGMAAEAVVLLERL